MDMVRFNLKNSKNTFRLQTKTSIIALENLKRIMGTSIGHGTLLHRTSIFQTWRVLAVVNRSIINHGLMRYVKNLLTEGSRLN
jgi:hypothetical protein